MSGVYVLSYSKKNVRTVTKKGFKRRGIRFYLYVALRIIKGEQVEVIEIWKIVYYQLLSLFTIRKS